MDAFDDTTYEPSRLMYWPSTPSDGEYICCVLDGDPVNPDEYLCRLSDWRDCSLWPTSSRQSAVIERNMKDQADPLAKTGIVGTFCRAYRVDEAVEKFLPDIYEPTLSGRYTYQHGSTSGGVVLYGDGRWAYSHHGTDPASGKLLNAFDLVRIHRFGDEDEKKSFGSMAELAAQDERVRVLLTNERLAVAREEFTVDGKWTKELLYKGTKVKDTLANLLLILANDPALKNIRYNQFAHQVYAFDLPWSRPGPEWRDADKAQLIAYVDQRYGQFSVRHYDEAFTKTTDDRAYHPVKEYLNNLPPWDEKPRAETLLVDFLNAVDTPYVRAVTRKTLAAAVARIYEPGIKFDSILVMDGKQDKGKSTLFNRLAGDDWYNDGLTLTDMQDKTGAEKLQGYWVLEIGELTGMKKSDIDSVKSFISRKDDKYRPSYGHVVESHKRQCIIVATVNGASGYLRDPTGNRRFWPVKTPGDGERNPWDITLNEVKQIWAETLVIYRKGEKLFLEGGIKENAAREQNAAIETDPRESMVADYLDTLLPENWKDLDLPNRREFLEGGITCNLKGVKRRDTVCPVEVWCECFRREHVDMRKQDAHDITTILRKLGWDNAEKTSRIPIYGKQRPWMKQPIAP
jgi:predicted P-loop ATPase